MTPPRQQALARLRFNFAETPDDVWHTSASHVDRLHDRVQHRIRAGITDAKNSHGPSPIGIVLQGRKGVGKTHMLGSVRRMVQDEDGYFFLIQLTTGAAFWEDVATAMRSELLRTNDNGVLQLEHLLNRLCDKAAVSGELRKAIVGAAPLTTDSLNRFIVAVRRVDARVAMECDDTIRALVLCATSDGEQSDLGKDYLAGWKSSAEWGLGKTKQPQDTVSDFSRVLAMTGPSVVAFDQLDSLMDLRTNAIDEQAADVNDSLALIASGLMQLRETTRRTLSIVACLPDTWQLLNSVAAATVTDRFVEAPILASIVDPEVARELVVKWLAPVYDSLAFTPPHPTWPVAPSAFGEASFSYTPRQLLRRIEEHAETCLYGEFSELTSFDVPSTPEAAPPVPALPEGPAAPYLADFDRRFDELCANADVDSALRKETVDAVMPDLLQAALKSWITEVGNDDRSWETEPPPEGDKQIHASLRRLLDEERDVVQRWVFRAIAPQHGNGVLRKIREARAAAGIREGVRNRHLVLLHRGEQGWGGQKTVSVVDDLARAGSPRFEITETDIRTFFALRELLGNQTYELLNWLVSRKPASKSAFLREILSTVGTAGPVGQAAQTGRQESRPPPEPVAEGEIALGLNGEIRLSLESLRKHAVVFAGSGAGKTVLLRRIIEECALRGVSAIVLDPNNDLARLGDAWPSPPEGWRPGDAASAAEYIANTEVVVWTPGRAGGRPLSFHPLPDFESVLDDEDEFTAAVDASVAALTPHARVTGGAKAAVRGQAVLREALTHYARWGGRSLSGFVDVLTELPDGVSKLTTATKTAADMAETLRAAMVNDPLLGGSGEPIDPGLLLTPSPGKRARVSVISFVGLPGEEQRQGFISQLQLEVFAWIKRNPAVDRPLSGLLVMDEAQTIAPSGTRTASTQSTILLASQARKYGLALLLATQAPKGLHNQVIGNATTQFFGRLNSPAQIAAANDMARAKASSIPDISRLERGQFYVTGEAFGFRQMRAPLCLSHHPPAPLRLEEVLDRARNGQ
ncbi:ATP-binding protein [Labedaea rhizosphaerae]|uniref:Uncharacterized protein DUF87 n=1 Tax=Labedaea rhizosphaerae TaxID=598644 RepID=A0A4R6S6N9_LABRH|nr:DUF87 domain-containing protein [Labedaea rhizosphaerae]TDP94984.1 uncharacterized protein DUF87 [Labedaea rhizosphaerae]